MTSGHGPDYRIRPAKAVVRRILLEILERLKFIGGVDEYDYLGFGSYSFVDFNLFHRRLNLPRLTSMEREAAIIPRARFNIPFSCVTVEPGEASLVLSRLPLDRKFIIWLDYTREFHSGIISDLRQVFTRAAPGSFLAVTVKAEEEDDPSATADRLESRAGKDLAPAAVTTPLIANERFPHVLQSCIETVISGTLRERNGPIFGTPSELTYRRVFGLSYSDSTRMLCTGGLLHSAEQSQRADDCNFKSLEFFQRGPDPARLNVPVLTPKEVWFLNSLIPAAEWTKLEGSGITRQDAEDFLAIYRYYPPYVEAELY